MKITSLTIANVACLADDTIQFHPGFNVITGPNASGKSLLAAASYHLLCCYVDQGAGFHLPELLPYFRGPSTVAATWTFSDNRSLHIIFSYDPATKTWRSQVAKAEVDFAHLRQAIGYFRQAHNIPAIVYIAATRGAVTPQQHQRLESSTWRRQSTQQRFSKLRALFDLVHGQEDALDDTIRAIMDKHFSSDAGPLAYPCKSRTVPDTSQLATDIRSLTAFHELASAASGSLEILFIVCETATLSDSLIIIDEPELHLHPKAQDMMAHYLHFLTTTEGGNNQVIISTHSLSMIYDQPGAKVINLYREGNLFVAKDIIVNGAPTDDYKQALEQLGYTKNTIMAGLTFHKKYKKKIGNFPPPTGAWPGDLTPDTPAT